MKILAIETSCDDTCVAVTDNLKILSNVISSQVKLHARYGGVWPFLAKREHQKNLPIVFKRAVKLSGNPEIDLIAVTVGPGLEPCLWVGINFAKEVARKWKKPIFPINHIEAHIFANFLFDAISSDRTLLRKSIFPAVCLIVSGGHTQLILMRNFGNYKILGETRDDAAGECFDKVARILGLDYPGGPAIAQAAHGKFEIRNSKFEIQLPRPMIYQKNYDFSFSGLKTAVLYDYKSRPEKIRESKKYIQQMCAEVQQAVIDVLIHKTLRAVRNYRAKTIILGGGVAANDELRKQFKSACAISNIACLVPAKILCTDNAAMVGITAYFRYRKDKIESIEEIKANANLRLS